MKNFNQVVTYCLLCLALCSCTKARQGATDNGFIATGIIRPVEIQVLPPLSLKASGNQRGKIKSDSYPGPVARMQYAVFNENSKGKIVRHAHILMASLPEKTWKFAMESWEAPNSLETTKATIDGKYFTVQTLIVKGKDDWFTKLWGKNNLETPDTWLARRLSYTPKQNIRIVAEYREPLPECIRSHARTSAISHDLKLSTLDRQMLWTNCEEALSLFIARGDASFRIIKATDSQILDPQIANLPETLPNLTHLAGEAELIYTERLR